MNSLDNLERLKNEFKNLQYNSIPPIGCSVALFDEDNIYRWRVTLAGPQDTYYRGALFFLEIIFPEDYPNKAPKINFITPIYHPNVNNCISSNFSISLGQVSFNAINNWKPSSKIREIIIKLFAIFYFPNIDLSYSSEITNEYKYNRDLYEKKVIYFTNKYANMSNMFPEKKYDEDWDFSFNEDDLNSMEIKPEKEIAYIEEYDANELMTLNIEIDGIFEEKIDCKLGELTKDVIKRVFDKIKIPEKNNILVIYNAKRIKLNNSIRDNNLHNMLKLIVIFDI